MDATSEGLLVRVVPPLGWARRDGGMMNWPKNVTIRGAVTISIASWQELDELVAWYSVSAEERFFQDLEQRLLRLSHKDREELIEVGERTLRRFGLRTEGAPP